MKQWPVHILVLVLVALAHSTPVRAKTEVFHFSGRSAFGIFSTTEECVVTTVIISAGDGTTHAPPEQSDMLSSAFLTVFRFDHCTNETLVDIAGDVQLDAKAFAGHQNSARLLAVIDVYERVSNTFFDVAVDVQWKGTGALTQGRSRFHVKGGGCIVNSHLVGTSRQAQATGSILVQGTNVTPASSLEALLMTAKESTVSIDCPEPG